jgi:ABC-type molybdate transport system substrate-binding protein
VSNFTFNVALGREVEFHNRVDGNDPAASALVLVVLSATAIEADSVLKDYDTLSALLAGASNEVTNGGYARKVLTDADISPYTVDDTNNSITLPLADQTWATIAAGNSWSKLLICYDSDTAGGTDANIVPVVAQDLFINGVAVVPNGNNIIVAFPLGYCVAS